MPFDQSEPSQAEIDEWFLTNPDVPDGTFELGLVLGGTVSAGAYTAGALDFLIEALDCWEAARGTEGVPQHRVVLRVITGTSGGGVNGAIAARALNFDFAPVPQTRSLGGGRAGNPFYDTWVNDLSLEHFLEASDLADELISFLDGRAIDRGAENIVGFTGSGVKSRPWIAAPLRLIITLTNLAGIPYTLTFPRGRSQTYVDHADFVRFSINYAGVGPGRPRPDEFILDFDQGRPDAMPWDQFSEFAKGTAAFPAGFPPRAFVRPTDHYRYRVRPRPQAPPGQPPYWVLTPDWGALLLSGAASNDGQCFLLAVDGGATDNQPIELAHAALCGVRDTNPRDANSANRAIVLIDPFGGKADLGLQQASTFANNLGSLFNAIIQQTRYDSRDLALAADPDVFSRFMLSPDTVPGTTRPALASEGLGAFLGFASADFMRHDYMLGRRDCQVFLQREFILAETNKAVFGAPWSASQKQQYVSGNTPAGFLPIIPLTGTAAQEQQLDPWPAGKLDPERYRGAIEKRYRALLRVATPNSRWLRAAAWLGARVSDGSVADKVIEAINTALVSASLKKPPPGGPPGPAAPPPGP